MATTEQKERCFWARKDGSFRGDIKFGDEMPALDSETKKVYLERGWITTKKPAEDFSTLKNEELERFRKLNAELSAENASLKKKNDSLEQLNSELTADNINLKNSMASGQSASKELEEVKFELETLKAELEDLPKNLKEANKTIKSLQKELAEATEPPGVD